MKNYLFLFFVVFVLGLIASRLYGDSSVDYESTLESSLEYSSYDVEYARESGYEQGRMDGYDKGYSEGYINAMREVGNAIDSTLTFPSDPDDFWSEFHSGYCGTLEEAVGVSLDTVEKVWGVVGNYC